MNKEWVVEYKDTKYWLSTALQERNKVPDEDMEKLIALHIEKLKTFEDMKNTDDVDDLRYFSSIVEAIEFDMQELWKFPRSKKFHEWYLVPKCKCPVMDNMELKGTGRRIISGDCKIHAF